MWLVLSPKSCHGPIAKPSTGVMATICGTVNLKRESKLECCHSPIAELTTGELNRLLECCTRERRQRSKDSASTAWTKHERWTKLPRVRCLAKQIHGNNTINDNTINDSINTPQCCHASHPGRSRTPSQKIESIFVKIDLDPGRRR